MLVRVTQHYGHTAKSMFFNVLYMTTPKRAQTLSRFSHESDLSEWQEAKSKQDFSNSLGCNTIAISITLIGFSTDSLTMVHFHTAVDLRNFS